MAEALQHDVLIIGGGGAGLRATIGIAENNPELSVAVVSKLYPMRSHTVSAEGGAAGVIRPEDTLDDHAYGTISGGDWLSDQDAVEYFVNEAPKELTKLEHWGCPWSRTPEGKVATRPFGGMKIERTWFAADKTGFHMLHALFQHSLRYNEVTRYDEWFAAELIVEDGRCQGVVAIDMLTGEVHPVLAKAVIMCTGGAGKVFPFTTNAAVKNGDGMAMAYRAGVPLKDMEFWQYHPTGLPGTGILITEASRGEGGILKNKDGYRYLQDYELGTPLDVNDPKHPVKRSMELGPRDRLSQAFYHERTKGNAIQTEYGEVVHLDVTHLGEAKIDKKIPFVRELCLRYAGIDPVVDPIPVRPVIHYIMGGIDTDIDGATKLPGLYAAGEVACVNLNGANRLGSNSLTELLVFGGRAGDRAAEFATKQPAFDVARLAKHADKVVATIEGFKSRKAEDRIAHIRKDMHDATEDGAGIYRDETSLKKSCDILSSLKARFANLGIDDKSETFNTTVINALELGFMLDVAETLAYSALERTESRGAHQRTDFPDRNDDKFLKHSMAYRDGGGGAPRIEYTDVNITRWPPGERKYGAESGLKREGAPSGA